MTCITWFSLIKYSHNNIQLGISLIFYLLGRQFFSMSFVWAGSFSGKLISKLTTRSPRLVGSLGWGIPWPGIFLTVLGRMTSSLKLRNNRSPDKVGTSTRVPHRAWKNKHSFWSSNSRWKNKYADNDDY